MLQDLARLESDQRGGRGDPGRYAARREELVASLERVFQQAAQGALLREGLNVVLVGQPNVGKSSLLNALAGSAAPSFSLSASPGSVSVAQGNSGQSTITTTVSGGFNSAITLSASGQPTGVTVSFNTNPIPAPGAGSSTMTMTVGSTVAGQLVDTVLLYAIAFTGTAPLKTLVIGAASAYSFKVLYEVVATPGVMMFIGAFLGP